MESSKVLSRRLSCVSLRCRAGRHDKCVSPTCRCQHHELQLSAQT